MSHPLVDQLRFARAEFCRGLEGVPPAEGERRFQPINSIGWMVGHMAAHENFYWVRMAQGLSRQSDLYLHVGTGHPPGETPLEEMWAAWQEITTAADPYLDSLRTEDLLTFLLWNGEPWRENIGTLLLRNIYHYWYHLGEASAVRQLLGHTDLPQFVGKFGAFPYRPEAGE